MVRRAPLNLLTLSLSPRSAVSLGASPGASPMAQAWASFALVAPRALVALASRALVALSSRARVALASCALVVLASHPRPPTLRAHSAETGEDRHHKIEHVGENHSRFAGFHPESLVDPPLA